MKNVMFLFLTFIVISCYQKPIDYKADPPPVINFPDPVDPIPPIVPPPRPGFVNLDLLEDTILLDLQTLGSNRERENARYIIGCDRHNIGDDLRVYRQGLDLAFNRISAERSLYPVTPIGPSGCIFRIDLEDYTITRTEWRLLENNTLLDFVSATVRNQNIQFLTQTRKPYLFGVETCVIYECDEVADKDGRIYYDFVDQDLITDKFLEDEGIDLQEQIDNEDNVYYSGFSQSQIALGKTRMVVVAKSTNGYCMGTYDTVLGGDDLFENTFTDELARAGNNGQLITNKIFKHNAQEWICTLLNSLFGLWRLNNNNGNQGGFAEVEAPTNIVINVKQPEIDPAIRIGDCNNCHFESVAIPFRDQLANHVRNNTAYDANEKRIAEIFFDYDRITAVIDEINRNNNFALQELNINAPSDPMSQEIWKPIRKEMTVDQVASYTFLTTEEFIRRLRGAAISSQVFGNLLNGGTVSLAILSANFNTLVAELNIYEDPNL